jgi:hypothetical protein
VPLTDLAKMLQPPPCQPAYVRMNVVTLNGVVVTSICPFVTAIVGSFACVSVFDVRTAMQLVALKLPH